MKSKNQRERFQQHNKKQYEVDGFSTLACMFTPVWWWHFGLETLRRSSAKYMPNLVKKSKYYSLVFFFFLYWKYMSTFCPQELANCHFISSHSETLEGARVAVSPRGFSNLPLLKSHTTLCQNFSDKVDEERCSLPITRSFLFLWWRYTIAPLQSPLFFNSFGREGVSTKPSLVFSQHSQDFLFPLLTQFIIGSAPKGKEIFLSHWCRNLG